MAVARGNTAIVTESNEGLEHPEILSVAVYTQGRFVNGVARGVRDDALFNDEVGLQLKSCPLLCAVKTLMNCNK